MAKKFFTRTTRARGVCPLYIQVAKRNPKVRMILCTGLDVDIATWNRVNRTENTWRNYTMTEEGKELNDKLTLIEKTINQLISDGRVMGNGDKDIIVEAIRPIVHVDLIDHEAEVERKRKEAEEARKRSIIGFYDYFLAGIQEGNIRYGDNKKYTSAHCVSWEVFGGFLKGYCKSKSLTFDDVTKPFADKFTVYLEKHGLMPTTINKWVNHFRRLCNYAAEEGVNTNAVSLKVWKERKAHDYEKRPEIYLTEEELNALYDMPLTGLEEGVRDVFVLGCLSCQRYSDYSKFTRDNFKTLADGTEVISLIQQKTGAYVEVPVLDERVGELCRKYDYDFPRFSKEFANKCIKNICERLSKSVPSLAEKHIAVIGSKELKREKTYAELCKRVEAGRGKMKDFTFYERKAYTEGKRYAEEHNGSPLWERNERGEVIRCKWELVTTHTARRSGVTNLYKTGLLNTREMMSISGHQTERVFDHYIRVGTSEQASRIAAKVKKAQEASNVVELRKAE